MIQVMRVCGDTDVLLLQYLIIGAEKRYPLSENGLAVLYDNGWGTEKDFVKALALFSRSSEAGYFRAQYNMAVSYESGDGVEFDPAKAMDLFQKSATQGYYAALLVLGDVYVSSSFLLFTPLPNNEVIGQR